jgi:RNA polymerase sigma-70 factor, ECF subfamily
MSDELLMERYREGSEEAFEKIYARYSPMVFAYARKRLKGSDAEDFFQKVWRQLHEKRSIYKGQPFAPWFFVLIRNLLIDEYRASSRRAPEFSDEFLEKLYGPEAEDHNLEELLSHLPIESADLVRKYYIEGVSYEDLEKQSGLSQTNLRQRLSRALRILREKVRGEI